MGISQSNLKNDFQYLKNKKYLSGPVSLYYLKKGDIKILLFGDEHFSLDYSCENNSIDFISFLNNIFSTNKKIDFLMESSYSYIENIDLKKEDIYHKEDSYITKVINYYISKGCFIRDKKECSINYPMVRFHSIDYRYSRLCAPTKVLNNIKNILVTMINKLEKSENYTYIINDFKKLMSKIYLIDSYEKIEDEIKKIFECTKMKKQIDNCDEYIRVKIIQYKNDILDMNNKKFKYQYNYIIENLKEIYEKNSFSYTILSSYIESLYTIIVYIRSIIIDIYCLARLFRKYKTNNNMKNIIIYAGASHIENYFNFLTKYVNFTIEINTKAVRKRCIDISNIYEIF